MPDHTDSEEESLVKFLQDRFGEDDVVAVQATSGPWEVDNETYAESISSPTETVVGGSRWSGEASVFNETADAIHIARWDPQRVLWEVAAKQQLLRWITEETHYVCGDGWYTCSAATDERDGGYCYDEARLGTSCDCGRDGRVVTALRLLAIPYDDHADYDPKWRSPHV
jgi:hypothetical protein